MNILEVIKSYAEVLTVEIKCFHNEASLILTVFLLVM